MAAFMGMPASSEALHTVLTHLIENTFCLGPVAHTFHLGPMEHTFQCPRLRRPHMQRRSTFNPCVVFGINKNLLLPCSLWINLPLSLLLLPYIHVYNMDIYRVCIHIHVCIRVCNFLSPAWPATNHNIEVVLSVCTNGTFVHTSAALQYCSSTYNGFAP